MVLHVRLRFLMVHMAVYVALIVPALQAEMIVVTRDKKNGTYRSLTHEETLRYQKTISDTLMKYQWPMCIQSDLTPQEIAEYLTPGKPYAQETFVQKKLQEATGSAEIDLELMFVPDSFYELFCIARQSINLFHGQYTQAIESRNIHALPFKVSFRQYSELYKDPLKASPDQARRELKKAFKDFNSLFFESSDGVAPILKMSNALTDYLFTTYPDLASSKSVLDISNALESRLKGLKDSLCQDMGTTLSFQDTTILNGMGNKVGSYFKNEPQTQIIGTVMELEYDARRLNKALLLRGTAPIEEPNMYRHVQNEMNTIAGTTLRQRHKFESTPGEHADLRSFAAIVTDDYKGNPYSISFANSLFAGFYQDPGGCTYYYLNGRNISDASSGVLGYGLMVNQQEYLQDGNKGLLYIPSLAPLTSLFERGQYCHPRSRVAVASKERTQEVEGLRRANEDGLIDPADIIVFEGSVMKHEEKFAAFLAENGRLIDINHTPEAQAFGANMMKSQQAIANVHRSIRIMGTKTIRKIARIGEQEIPGVSRQELFEILTQGPTQEQYVALERGLKSMTLAPVDRNFFELSTSQLLEKIFLNCVLGDLQSSNNASITRGFRILISALHTGYWIQEWVQFDSSIINQESFFQKLNHAAQNFDTPALFEFLKYLITFIDKVHTTSQEVASQLLESIYIVFTKSPNLPGYYYTDQLVSEINRLRIEKSIPLGSSDRFWSILNIIVHDQGPILKFLQKAISLNNFYMLDPKNVQMLVRKIVLQKYYMQYETIDVLDVVASLYDKNLIEFDELQNAFIEGLKLNPDRVNFQNINKLSFKSGQLTLFAETCSDILDKHVTLLANLFENIGSWFAQGFVSADPLLSTFFKIMNHNGAGDLKKPTACLTIEKLLKSHPGNFTARDIQSLAEGIDLLQKNKDHANSTYRYAMLDLSKTLAAMLPDKTASQEAAAQGQGSMLHAMVHPVHNPHTLEGRALKANYAQNRTFQDQQLTMMEQQRNRMLLGNNQPKERFQLQSYQHNPGQAAWHADRYQEPLRHHLQPQSDQLYRHIPAIAQISKEAIERSAPRAVRSIIR